MKWTIKGEEGEVTLRVRSYYGDNPDDSYSYNLLHCDVEVKVRAFTGADQIYLSTHMLRKLQVDLSTAYQNIAGKAELANDDHTLRLVIIFTKLGEVEISGCLQFQGYNHSKLEFSFSSDQTYIGQTLPDLEQAVKVFHVR